MRVFVPPSATRNRINHMWPSVEVSLEPNASANHLSYSGGAPKASRDMYAPTSQSRYPIMPKSPRSNLPPHPPSYARYADASEILPQGGNAYGNQGDIADRLVEAPSSGQGKGPSKKRPSSSISSSEQDSAPDRSSAAPTKRKTQLTLDANGFPETLDQAVIVYGSGGLSWDKNVSASCLEIQCEMDNVVLIFL